MVSLVCIFASPLMQAFNYYTGIWHYPFLDTTKATAPLAYAALFLVVTGYWNLAYRASLYMRGRGVETRNRGLIDENCTVSLRGESNNRMLRASEDRRHGGLQKKKE